ncbi:MAG TPA: hypothetical protein VMF64_03245 [Steroidobacteraceae bacterium]|nr:hypothetical protein [Steroidobacteraceae bacterium]
MSLPLAALLALVLVGCQRAESPSSVAKDVHAAEQKEQSKTQRALANASQDEGKAQQRVEEKVADRDDIAAKDAYKVAVAKADGEHDVALQRCKQFSGDAQSRCKRQADADYDATKANAKAQEVSQTR